MADSRGHISDLATQHWVRLTGKRIRLEDTPWLSGVVGVPSGIGPGFFDEVAQSHGWIANRAGAHRGIIPDFSKLRSLEFDPDDVDASVAAFYESTSGFDMDAWSEWCGVFRPLGALLAMLFSRRLQQLNVPLSPLDSSRGMTSEVLHVIDPETNDLKLTAWVRVLLGNGHVLYAGSYSTCQVPGYSGTCVKVVFPLPNGNAMVIMRPVAHNDGSFSVVSAGAKFGDPGFYFTVHTDTAVYAKYVRALKESIRVYPNENGSVSADHVLTLWGLTFLRLHYRMRWRTTAA